MEPYLINPPRRRRRPRGKPRGHRSGCGCFVCKGRNPHRARRRRGRRRHSRNPEAVMYGLNKRRRRRSHRGRRHYRRNPGRGVTGQLTEALPKVGWGVVGALGTEAVPAVASRFFPLPQGRAAAFMVKAASGLTIAWAVRRFVGRAQGNAALIGALLPLALEPVRTFILPMIVGGGGAAPVGAYLPQEAYLMEGGMEYLGPGSTVGQYEDEDVVSRLEPGERI